MAIIIAFALHMHHLWIFFNSCFPHIMGGDDFMKNNLEMFFCSPTLRQPEASSLSSRHKCKALSATTSTCTTLGQLLSPCMTEDGEGV